MDPGSKLQQVKDIPAYWFASIRIVLGIYLALHFIHLVPYGAEVFGSEGLLPDARANFTHGLLPNPLEYTGTPWIAPAFLFALSLLSILFACGVWRRPTAILLWYGWACLFNRNNLISNPSLPYIGLLLLLCAVIPTGEGWCVLQKKENDKWFFPAWAYYTAWILMAVGYSFSGLDKIIESPSWRDGTALSHVLHLPLARPGMLREGLLSLPEVFLKGATWGVLALEILFLPLSLNRKTRPWVWGAMVAMHLCILSLMAFTDLVAGMLLLHFFTFDPAWLRKRKNRKGTWSFPLLNNRPHLATLLTPNGSEMTAPNSTIAPEHPIIFFDGTCGLCNRFVDMIVRADRKRVFKFAPLTGTTARKWLPPLPEDPKRRSMFYFDERGLHANSDASLQIYRRLGGRWWLLSLARVVPRIFRDLLYRIIAHNRYNWFGRSKECRVPTAMERERFLP